LVAEWILTISWHDGRYGTRRQSIPHLETTCEIHHIYEEENVLISGTREMSAVADSAEPKQFRQLVYPAIMTYTK
jgi:hypothetical protein